jgi:hypothetical protein
VKEEEPPKDEDSIPQKFLLVVEEMRKQITHYEALLKQQEADRQAEWVAHQQRESAMEREREASREREARTLEREKEAERVRSVERARDKALLEEAAKEKEKWLACLNPIPSPDLDESVAALRDEVLRLRAEEAKYLNVIETLKTDMAAMRERDRACEEMRAAERTAEAERERMREAERAVEASRASQEAAQRECDRARERDREHAREAEAERQLQQEVQVDSSLARALDVAAIQVVEQWRERRKHSAPYMATSYAIFLDLSVLPTDL